MKFQIISDIHLEFKGALQKIPEIPVNSKILCLLGDIGFASEKDYETYLLHQAQRFEHVLILAGNHEFYKDEYFTVKKQILNVCAKRPNLHFLDRNSLLVINGEEKIRFLGCTLWSHVPAEHQQQVSRSLNDYAMIQVFDKVKQKKVKLTVDQTNQWHKEDVAWLKQEIEAAKKNNEKVVVLTHHAPIMKGSSDPVFDGDPVNHAFATQLDQMMGGNVKIWAFGHTHYSNKLECNGTVIISNQLGYVTQGEKCGFVPDLVLEVK